MRVISFGIYSNKAEYPRHRNLLQGLRENGVEVVECHYPMALRFEDRFVSATSAIGTLRYGLLLIRSYLRLAAQFIIMPSADAILVGSPGYFHVHLARLLRCLKNRNAILAYDVFVPLYSTVVHDRKIIREGSAMARALHCLEASACRIADICLVDTTAHADYLCSEFGVRRSKCVSIPVGPLFPPYPDTAQINEGKPVFSVLFVGTYIPLQGVEIILEASKLLAGNARIQFLLVGSGQLRREMENRARDWKLHNVRFRGWINSHQLGEFIRSFDVSLGIFGTTEKASKVIPHKVFDACAAGVPFITADTPAIREAFKHGENAYLVPPGDPKALATAILHIKDNPDLRRRLATGAHRTSQEIFSLNRIGRDLAAAFECMAQSPSGV